MLNSIKLGFVRNNLPLILIKIKSYNMIKFVNAKINIGLNIVSKRPDGYHDLQTIFFPIGIESGMPHQPEAFDDILEVTCNPDSSSGCRFQFMGRRIDCPPAKNLVVKAASLFFKEYSKAFDDLESFGMFEINLDKHLPDGAGLGGGSADASFTLKTLNEVTGEKFSQDELAGMAIRLGADCPFFLYNTPCFGEGLGEVLTPIELPLKDKKILIVKPEINISTREAFEGISVGEPSFNLRNLSELPLDEWKNNVFNDFEKTIFPLYPELKSLKERIYESGAFYASMSGSGSAIYGIFDHEEDAIEARNDFESTYDGVWLFGI